MPRAGGSRRGPQATQRTEGHCGIADNDPCTLDTCDPQTGTVSHAQCSALNPTVATALFDAEKFVLDSGVQHGVGNGAIDPLRAALVRGRALVRSGNTTAPLPGV